MSDGIYTGYFDEPEPIEVSCTTGSTASQTLDIKEIKKFMVEQSGRMEKIRREANVSLRKVICPECGGSPKILDDGMGDAISMCDTVHRAILDSGQVETCFIQFAHSRIAAMFGVVLQIHLCAKLLDPPRKDTQKHEKLANQ